MPLWQRFVIVGAVLVVTAAVARLIDRRIARRELAPEAVTRYRVLRRSITTVIVFVGLFSALLVIPNEKLASDTILNSTIVSREKVAEITLQVPLSQDLRSIVEDLRDLVARERDGDVAVTALNGSATVTVSAAADGPLEAERLQNELRLRAHERLRAAGIYE